MSDLPWMKFYPADWRSEERLKLISRAARSLWLDMLCLIFEGGTGRLEMDGRPMTSDEVAKILGDNPRTVKKLIAEIEKAGVSSKDQEGFTVSRRIIRDKQKREKDVSNGRKGGSPILKNNDLEEIGVNPPIKAQRLEARDQKLEARKKEEPPGLAETLLPDELVLAVKHYNFAAQRWGLPKCQRLTDDRKRKLKLRLRECGGLEGWNVALEKIGKSALLKGQKTNWKADFDFLMQEASFTRLMEGKYDDTQPSKPTSTTRFAAAADELRDDHGLGEGD